MSSPVQFNIRPNTERGNSDHGWLKTFHSFSFAEYAPASYYLPRTPRTDAQFKSYYDPRHTKFGNLRVLNEDRVEPHTGFGTHGHREFEIFSYIVNGELEQ